MTETSADSVLFDSLDKLTPELKSKLLQVLLADDSVEAQKANKLDALAQKTISSLRKNNASLKDELYKTLNEYRNAQVSYARNVEELEKDLQMLRTELTTTANNSKALEESRRKLLKEKIESQKEKNKLESVDTELISDLQDEVKALQTENQRLHNLKSQADSEISNLKKELETTLLANTEYYEKSRREEYFKEEFEKQVALVEELKEELEYERQRSEALENHDDTFDHDAVKARRTNLRPLSNEAEHGPRDDWEWNSWIDRSWTKIWDRDISGLRNEIGDLNENRNMAFHRMQESISEMVGNTVDMIVPTTVKKATEQAKTIGSIIANGEASSLIASPGTLAIVGAEETAKIEN